MVGADTLLQILCTLLNTSKSVEANWMAAEALSFSEDYLPDRQLQPLHLSGRAGCAVADGELCLPGGVGAPHARERARVQAVHLAPAQRPGGAALLDSDPLPAERLRAVLLQLVGVLSSS